MLVLQLTKVKINEIIGLILLKLGRENEALIFCDKAILLN